MSAEDIRSAYILYIGAGAVAAGGIISLCRAMPLILGSIAVGLRDLADSRRAASLPPAAPTATFPSASSFSGPWR